MPGDDSDRIANYTVTFTNDTSPTSAVVTNLTTLNGNSVNFYWISEGEGRTVQYSAKINNKSVSRTVTFNVKRPTASITATTGTTNIGVDSQSQATELRLGNPDSTPGITFTRSFSVPSGFSGTTQWVQVFTQKTASLTLTSGQSGSLTTVGLDDVYPYPLDGDSTAANAKTSDTPALVLDNSFIAGSVDFRATMWRCLSHRINRAPAFGYHYANYRGHGRRASLSATQPGRLHLKRTRRTYRTLTRLRIPYGPKTQTHPNYPLIALPGDDD